MFTLSQLGPYRIERTEEYDYIETSDKSYAEMIRVKGSISDPPEFTTPSHLYKYSETELGLYLKDKKNQWRPLGTLLNKTIYISDEEMDFIFPVEMFPKVAAIVTFIRKRGPRKLSPEAIAQRDAMNANRHTDKVNQKEPNLHSSVHEGVIIPDGLEGTKKPVISEQNISEKVHPS
jgi:hypothetical protein